MRLEEYKAKIRAGLKQGNGRESCGGSWAIRHLYCMLLKLSTKFYAMIQRYMIRVLPISWHISLRSVFSVTRVSVNELCMFQSCDDYSIHKNSKKRFIDISRFNREFRRGCTVQPPWKSIDALPLLLTIQCLHRSSCRIMVRVSSAIAELKQEVIDLILDSSRTSYNETCQEVPGTVRGSKTTLSRMWGSGENQVRHFWEPGVKFSASSKSKARNNGFEFMWG